MQPQHPSYRPPRLVDPRLTYGRGRYVPFPQGPHLPSGIPQTAMVSPMFRPSSSASMNLVENCDHPVFISSDVRSRSQQSVHPYPLPNNLPVQDSQWHSEIYPFDSNPNLSPIEVTRSRLAKFAIRSREMMENHRKLVRRNRKPVINEKDEEDVCACLPPLEVFTETSKICRRKHFYEYLQKDDILCVKVLAHSEGGLICSVICMDGGKRRDIHDCAIKVFCPSAHCQSLSVANFLDGYQMNDILRVVVFSINEVKIVVSMKEDHLPKESRGNFKMGLISDEELPIHFRRQISMKSTNYNDMLRQTLSFNNPGASSHLAQFFELPISQRFSFLRDFHNVEYPEDEYGKHLRKVQSAEMAKQSVEEGIKYLKSGSHLEAQQCLNKALQIDSDNLDALVARGCLYANTHNLNKAAEDFDRALSIDPDHVNARKYMSETLCEIGKQCEDKGDHDSAIQSYRRSCQVNIKNNEALEALKSIIEKKGATRSRSSSDELKNMYKDIKCKSYYETSHKLTLLLEEDKKKRRRSRKNRSSSSSSTNSSDSSSASSDSSVSSSSSNSDSSASSSTRRRSRRSKKSKRSRSKKSKRKKKKKRARKDSIKAIPGIRIEKSQDTSKDKKTSDIASRKSPKRQSPKISFTLKKSEPEIRTLKPSRPFASPSKSLSSPKRNPTNERIVYNLDKLKPVSIEFVRNGPVDKAGGSKSNRKSPPPRRARSRSRGRLYIPGRSKSRSRSRGRRRRSRSRSNSRSRAICRAVLSPKRKRSPFRERARSPRRSRRSSSRDRSRKTVSPSRGSQKTATAQDLIKKVTEEAKKVEAALQDKTFEQN